VKTLMSSHFQEEDNKNLMETMDSRTQDSNGTLMQKHHMLNINIIIIIELKLRILVTRELLRRYNNSQQTINQFSHNHGEESRRLIQSMDSRTPHSNGTLMQNHHMLNTNITIIIRLWLRILETRESPRKFSNLLPTINQYSHSHGEE